MESTGASESARFDWSCPRSLAQFSSLYPRNTAMTGDISVFHFSGGKPTFEELGQESLQIQSHRHLRPQPLSDFRMYQFAAATDQCLPHNLVRVIDRRRTFCKNMLHKRRDVF